MFGCTGLVPPGREAFPTLGHAVITLVPELGKPSNDLDVVSPWGAIEHEQLAGRACRRVMGDTADGDQDIKPLG